jgi:hypothetical protein
MSEQRAPILKLRQYQREAFAAELRRLFLLWSRQKGKSYTLASKSIDWMMKTPGALVTFISASVALGTEIVLKEAKIWSDILTILRGAADRAGLRLTSNVDGLDFDAVCDVFEHSKLETRLWHSNSVCSRSRVIAPNPDTAVGWTGYIVGDEVGRWPEAQGVFEAVLPFMDSNPEFALWLATTPPPDDKHYTFELFAPPSDAEFAVSPVGNWYRSAAGIMCHRVDAWDAHAAGVPLFHPETKQPVSPEEHRDMAFDKAAWDRNYALRFLAGGTAAVSIAAIARAMATGKGACVGINITEAVVA